MELTEPGLRVKNAEKMQQSKRASGEEMLESRVPGMS